MKVGIVGGGAIGLFFAASLAKWFPVTLFTRTEEQADLINKQGITVEEEGTKSVHFVQALPVDKLHEHEQEYIFVAVKQYKLSRVLSMLEKSRPHEALVFLQNGMSHLNSLTKLAHEHIYVAAVEHGIFKSDPARIHVRGRGKTNLAVFRGNQQAIEEMIEQTKTSFPFRWCDDYEKMLLGKMAANTVINPLTAILRVTNGELVSNPYYLEMAKKVYQEFFAVFANKLNAKSWEEIVHICRTTAGNRSSMLKDIESGRPTEIDAILGYVLSQAAKKEIQLPIIEALYHMIKGLEYREQE